MTAKYESEKIKRRGLEDEIHTLRNINELYLGARDREIAVNIALRKTSKELDILKEANETLQSQISVVLGEKETLANSHMKVVVELETKLLEKDTELEEVNRQHAVDIQQLMGVHENELAVANDKHADGQQFWLAESQKYRANNLKLDEMANRILQLESEIKQLNIDNTEKINTLATTVTELQRIQQELSSLSISKDEMLKEISESSGNSILLAGENAVEIGKKTEIILKLEKYMQELNSENDKNIGKLKNTLAELKNLSENYASLTHTYRISLAHKANEKKNPELQSFIDEIKVLNGNLHDQQVLHFRMEAEFDELKVKHAQCGSRSNMTEPPNGGHDNEDSLDADKPVRSKPDSPLNRRKKRYGKASGSFLVPGASSSRISDFTSHLTGEDSQKPDPESAQDEESAHDDESVHGEESMHDDDDDEDE